MKTQAASSLVALLLLAGCGSPAVYVEPEKGAGVVSVDQINIQDFAVAADGMLQSLYDSPAFVGRKAADGGAPVLLVGRVRNDSADNFDTDLLVKKLTVSVTRSAKARVASGAQTTIPADYTLTGKILETRANAGKTRQTTFTFQLTLTDAKTGLSVWEEEKQVTKQGTKNAVGF